LSIVTTMAMALNFENTMLHRYDVVSAQVDSGLMCTKQFQTTVLKLIECMAKDPVKATQKLLQDSTQTGKNDGLRRVWSVCDTAQNMLLSHLVAHREFFTSLREKVVAPLDSLYKKNYKLKKQLDNTMNRIQKCISNNKKELVKQCRKAQKTLDELKINLRSYRMAKKTLKLQEQTKKLFQTYENLQQQTGEMQRKLHNEILPQQLKQFENMEKYRLKVVSVALKDFYTAFNERGQCVNNVLSVLKEPTTMQPERELTDCLLEWSDSYGPPTKFVEVEPYMLPCRPEEITTEKFDAEIPRKRKLDKELIEMKNKAKEDQNQEKERRRNNRDSIKEETQRVLAGGTPARKTKFVTTFNEDASGASIGKVTSPVASKLLSANQGIMNSSMGKGGSFFKKTDDVTKYFGASMDLTLKKTNSPPPKEVKFKFLLKDMDEEEEKSMSKEQQKAMKKRRNRDKTVHEVWSTETQFVKCLDRTIQYYLRPLEKNRILSFEQVNTIFSNIITIHGVNKKFLTDIESRLAEWDNNDCLGDVFKKMTPFFKMYTSYVNNHELACQTLKKLGERGDTKWTSFLADTQVRAPPLASLLITPIQRIPRYRLLIQEILKNTAKDHPDFDQLTEALKLAADVAEHMNENVRARENRDEIRKIEAEFSGNVSFIAPSRSFKYKGQLVKKCRRYDVLYEFFLFSDLLVYASKLPGTGKLKLHRAIDIDQSFSVNIDIKSAEKNPAFVINNSNKSFVVYAPSLEEMGVWMEYLQKAVKEERSKRKGKAENKTTIAAKPLWAQDSTSSDCACCKKAFTIYLRRHHCRKCGCLVCSACSKRRMKLHGGNTPERVCDICLGRGLGGVNNNEVTGTVEQTRRKPSFRRVTQSKPDAPKPVSSQIITPGEKEVISSSSEDEELIEEYFEGDVEEEPAPGEDGSRADLEGALPKGWILYLTEDDHTPYYFNENTQVTVWQRPT